MPTQRQPLSCCINCHSIPKTTELKLQPHCLKTIYADVSIGMLLVILHSYYLYPVHFDFLPLGFFSSSLRRKEESAEREKRATD